MSLFVVHMTIWAHVMRLILFAFRSVFGCREANERLACSEVESGSVCKHECLCVCVCVYPIRVVRFNLIRRSVVGQYAITKSCAVRCVAVCVVLLP